MGQGCQLQWAIFLIEAISTATSRHRRPGYSRLILGGGRKRPCIDAA